MPPERLVTEQQELDEIILAARRAGSVALDTEFLREKTYRSRLCLVQIATDGDLVVVDPLARIDLGALAALVSDPGVEVLVHAGRQDFELFYERYGVAPRNVYDVQLAAGFAGLGASLPYGRLVEELAGATLQKGEAYTDWCRRPLTDAQLTYAANDVRYLHDIAAKLKARLDELGRGAWVAEEMLALEDETLYATDPAEAWRRVSGRGSLSSRQTSVLKELAGWREEAAARRDLPRGWIVKDPSLVEIARRAPKSTSELKAIRGLNAKEAERSGREILDAVERGRSSPAIASGPSPPKSALMRARMLSGLCDAVLRARCERASVATEVVATRGELEALLADVFSERAREEDHRLLRGWRRDLAGGAILALAAGRMAVRVADAPPYIEEVVL
ncbi:MAG TPA: ribonuclease D [Actinomycetota bacterium]|nr:ribonuclease D [Actinomycetota bacterium]